MKKIFLSTFLLLLFSVALSAHGTHGTGLMAGLSHPILGLDHLLAIFCVGLLSAQMGIKSSWMVPLVFAIAMLLSGWLGIGTDGFICMEEGIALSVVVMGIAVALKKKMSLVAAILAAGVIGIFHGYAHGVEMPEASKPFVYISGFLLGVLIIFLGSIGIGNVLLQNKINSERLQYVGAFIAGMGLVILIG